MVANDEYVPINCDDYDSLELACNHHWILTLTLKGGETIKGKATDLTLKKKVEYLALEIHDELKEIRLDAIESFSHPKLGTVTIK